MFQAEVENFVLKMAAEFPSRRDQLIFLINNYDMMLSVLMVSRALQKKIVFPFVVLIITRSIILIIYYKKYLSVLITFKKSGQILTFLFPI